MHSKYLANTELETIMDEHMGHTLGCVWCLLLPNYQVCANDELGFGIPLVVGDVVVCLQPYPLLAFGQEPIVTGLSFSKLHHC